MTLYKYVRIYFVLILGLLFCPAYVQSQVTMGATKPPAKAALLQLKEIEPTNTLLDNQTVETGGLLLPRVQLVDLTSLEPFIDPADGDYATQKLLHVGMIVYNVVPATPLKIYKGMYTWNGKEWTMLVNQTTSFGIQVSNRELIFETGVYSSGVVAPQSTTVTWLPIGNVCDVSYEHLVNGGITEFVPPTTLSGAGTAVITVAPDAIPQSVIDLDPFYERSSKMTVSLDHNAEHKELNIMIRQINYALLLTNTLTTGTLGQAYKWKAACNTSWDVTISGDASIFAVAPPASGGNNVLGEEFNFVMSNDASKDGKSATITFSSPNGSFPSQSLTITAQMDFPNVYMVKPNSSVTFPVRKAYQVWKQKMGENLPTTGLSLELVWQDAQSLITGIALEGTDDNSNIKVTTGNVVPGGNALVALKIGGKIKWSWHIWVSDYNPGNDPTIVIPDGSSGSSDVDGGKVWSYNNSIFTTHFMDRNLGAMSDELAAGAPSSGNLYQYGSTFPFPGPVGPRTTAIRTMYDISNTVIPRLTPIPVAVSNNLQNVIEAPHQFYLGDPESDYNWYTDGTIETDPYLWEKEDGSKGLFDPCPDGWRIPSNGVGNTNPWFGLPANAEVYGYNWEAEGAGKWPYQGLIFYHTGLFANHLGGYYQSRAEIAGYGSILSLNPLRTLYFNPKATGMSVRCVRDI